MAKLYKKLRIFQVLNTYDIINFDLKYNFGEKQYLSAYQNSTVDQK